MSLNDFKFLGDLVKKYQSRLYIEYEYEAPKKFARQFVSSLELLETPNQQQNPPEKWNQPKKVLGKFQISDLMRLKDNSFYYVPTNQKFSTILECISSLQQKFNIEDILQAFSWQDFERFLDQTLDSYGCFTIRTFRFSDQKKRHEVDIIARDGQKIYFIDAKHWNSKTASSSALMKVAEEQVERAKHLAANPNIAGELLKKLKVNPNQKFHSFLIYPIILISSNIPNPMIVNGVPVFPVYQWNEFMHEFSKILHNLRPISIKKAIFQQSLNNKIKIKKKM